ncbi:MAG: hypothetical protein WCL32_00065 [Planctomycetota bacterium]|jgi:hypothetical protein
MAKKSSNGGVNKSKAIRDLFIQQPDIKAKEVVETLGKQGIEVKSGLVYIVKGKMQAGQQQVRKEKRAATRVASGNSDAVATILKVKTLANELGGLGSLKAIVDLLSE